MEETYIRGVPLENGLFLKLYDASRRFAGDRWLVKLIARIPIPVDEVWQQTSEELPSAAAVKELLGDTLVFEQEKTRNFIDEQEKEEILQSMTEEFFRHALAYLGRPEFGWRCIRRKFRENHFSS
ncbi:MAG: hypothetical protein R6X08_03165 [Desulfosalsimonadaceae bacterium]